MKIKDLTENDIGKKFRIIRINNRQTNIDKLKNTFCTINTIDDLLCVIIELNSIDTITDFKYFKFTATSKNFFIGIDEFEIELRLDDESDIKNKQQFVWDKVHNCWKLNK